MATELLPVGPPTALVQNTIYALPAVKCTLYTDATTPTIQQSNAVGFSSTTAVTLSGGASTVSGGFLKTTSTSVTITLKRD